MAVTITDVAKLAGVSPSTVSRTCKNNPAISEETKAKVRAAMEQLGYQHPLVQNKEYDFAIGVIFPTFRPSTTENPFYLEALHGISNHCNEHNIPLIIHTGDTLAEVLNSVKHSPAQGFIFLYSDVDDELINFMYKSQQKFVLLGKALTNINDTIYVDTDNIQAGKDACDYLIQLGHRRIAYIGTDKTRVFSSDRKAGYLVSLTTHQLPYNENLIVELLTRITNDYSPLEKILQGDNPPTALILCDDLLATAVLPVLQRLGLKVPEDISLVSFNNSILAKLMSPPLTSMDINAYQLGAEAAIQLCKHLAEDNLVATKTLIPHELVIRKSCASPKNR